MLKYVLVYDYFSSFHPFKLWSKVLYTNGMNANGLSYAKYKVARAQLSSNFKICKVEQS